MTPELAANKCQERPSGASTRRIEGNHFASVAPPWTPMGEPTALPQVSQLVGRDWLPPSQEPHHALGPLGLGLWPSSLAQEASQHDWLDPPMASSVIPVAKRTVFPGKKVSRVT